MFTTIRLFLAVCCGAILASGCRGETRLEDLPPGLIAVGRAPALLPALDALGSWTDTRIAALMQAHRAAVAACPDDVSLRWTGEGAPEIQCAIPDDLKPLRALGEDRDLTAVLPDQGGGRAWVTGDVDDRGGLDLTVNAPAPETGSVWDLVVPAEGSPGPWQLQQRDALVHLRVRQARAVDLSRLVGQGNQGETLFRLRSSLFSSTVLDQTWELAVYPAAEGFALPRMALAVGVRSEALARKAVDEYVGTLARQWSFEPQPWSSGATDGACLRKLNLLPELEPCYAFVGGGLVITWNESGLAAALDPEPGEPEQSTGTAWLSRFRDADARLSAAFEPGAPPPVVHYPWSELRLSCALQGDRVVLSLRASP